MGKTTPKVMIPDWLNKNRVSGPVHLQEVLAGGLTSNPKTCDATTLALNHVLAQQYCETILNKQRSFNSNSLGGLVRCPGPRKGQK